MEHNGRSLFEKAFINTEAGSAWMSRSSGVSSTHRFQSIHGEHVLRGMVTRTLLSTFQLGRILFYNHIYIYVFLHELLEGKAYLRFILRKKKTEKSSAGNFSFVCRAMLLPAAFTRLPLPQYSPSFSNEHSRRIDTCECRGELLRRGREAMQQAVHAK